MLYSRRDIGKLALAAGFGSGFASTLLEAAAKPNSKFKGVQIGCITYSYRSMPDQSAEATLKYILDSGISAVELMAGPIQNWMRKKGKWEGSEAASLAAAANAGRAGGRGPGGMPGGMGGMGGGSQQQPTWAPVANLKIGWDNGQPSGQWNGQACPAGRGAGGPGGAPGGAPGGQAGGAGRQQAGGAPAGQAGGAGGQQAAGAPGGMPGMGGGRGQQTPEQQAAAAAERKWRLGLSMNIFKELKKYYNNAGVTIYAIKDLPLTTNEDLDWTYTVGRTLGATHVTMELPAGANAKESLKRFGDGALRNKMLTAYHSHGQGSMTAFDEAFEISKGNMSNVDLGHMLTNPNRGGSPMDFLNKHHARICSVHIKDRTTPEHCALNLPWGYGEFPFKEVFTLISKNKWNIPCTIEQEYSIPQGSDAVKEVARCVEYARNVIAKI
jgi:sugar phosphate isomerase/epimerase